MLKCFPPVFILSHLPPATIIGNVGLCGSPSRHSLKTRPNVLSRRVSCPSIVTSMSANILATPLRNSADTSPLASNASGDLPLCEQLWPSPLYPNDGGWKYPCTWSALLP